MKKIVTMFILVFAAAGCTKNGGGTEDPPAPATLDAAPKSDIRFTAAATEHYDITITTNQASWSAEPDQTWCKITNRTAAGFRITADPNTGLTAPAPAKVTITAGKAIPVVINVTQLAADPAADPLAEVIMFVYTVWDPYRRVLCVMKPDGTGIRTVHDSDNPSDPENGDISRGVLSPDGTKAVVFAGYYDMYVYDLAAKSLSQLALYSDECKPDEAVWSPDGSRILYCNWADDENTALETIQPDGTGKTPLTGAGYNFGRPAYTPDGTKIVASNFLDNKYICAMKADGTSLSTILTAAGDHALDCAHPAGNSRILYFNTNTDTGIISLYTAGIDGSAPAELEKFDARYTGCDYLTVNPAGTLLCYYLYDSADGTSKVFVRSLSGNTLGTAKVLTGNYTRLKFGMIKKSIYDALPAFGL